MSVFFEYRSMQELAKFKKGDETITEGTQTWPLPIR